MSTGIITDWFCSSAMCPRVSLPAVVAPGFSPACRPQGRRCEIRSLFRRVFQHVRLHGVERVRRIREASSSKRCFDLAQERVALNFASKFNRHASLVVGRGVAIELGSEVERDRSEEHTSELQSQSNLVCRLLLEKKKKKNK